MSLLHFNFYSKYLRGNTDVNIILPDLPHQEDPENFYKQGKKYPVLWLLHGGMGDYSDWLRKSMIELYATENELIVVMPSGLNSSYCNWLHFGGSYNSHDYIIHELMPLVYGWFPASEKREDNFMAGLSMGGQGTWKFAVNYPEKFAACAMLSAPAFDYGAKYAEEKAAGRSTGHTDLVDMYGGVEEFNKTRENTRGVVSALVQSGKADMLPRLYASGGTEDSHIDEFRDTVKFFRSLGIPVEYKETPNYAHEWRFWDISIQEALTFFGFGGNCT